MFVSLEPETSRKQSRVLTDTRRRKIDLTWRSRDGRSSMMQCEATRPGQYHPQMWLVLGPLRICACSSCGCSYTLRTGQYHATQSQNFHGNDSAVFVNFAPTILFHFVIILIPGFSNYVYYRRVLG